MNKMIVKRNQVCKRRLALVLIFAMVLVIAPKTDASAKADSSSKEDGTIALRMVLEGEPTPTAVPAPDLTELQNARASYCPTSTPTPSSVPDYQLALSRYLKERIDNTFERSGMISGTTFQDSYLALIDLYNEFDKPTLGVTSFAKNNDAADSQANIRYYENMVTLYENAAKLMRAIYQASQSASNMNKVDEFLNLMKNVDTLMSKYVDHYQTMENYPKFEETLFGKNSGNRGKNMYYLLKEFAGSGYMDKFSIKSKTYNSNRMLFTKDEIEYTAYSADKALPTSLPGDTTLSKPTMDYKEVYDKLNDIRSIDSVYKDINYVSGQSVRTIQDKMDNQLIPAYEELENARGKSNARTFVNAYSAYGDSYKLYGTTVIDLIDKYRDVREFMSLLDLIPEPLETSQDIKNAIAA